MSDLDLEPNVPEGMLELKNDNELNTNIVGNSISQKLCKIDNGLLESLTKIFQFSEAFHENGWVNAFGNVGWRKSL